ncbi:hypothetical protein BJ508DRAFT_333676 [Ascobolus immersus RN42]|uniref:Uncharacterized protein n=1 Tax=Ascobolus immersus RN42 TaxID=1160509 RepID=A0A3N4HIU1_ASCIM|nr:hypothetical protein BJ508DRAFT_333676 [Ascobolus immersus RN42]
MARGKNTRKVNSLYPVYARNTTNPRLQQHLHQSILERSNPATWLPEIVESPIKASKIDTNLPLAPDPKPPREAPRNGTIRTKDPKQMRPDRKDKAEDSSQFPFGSVVPATSQPAGRRAVGLLDGISSPRKEKSKKESSNRFKNDTLPAVVTSFTQRSEVGQKTIPQQSQAHDTTPSYYYKRYSTTPEFTPTMSQKTEQKPTTEEAKGGNIKEKKHNSGSNPSNKRKPITSKRQISEELYHSRDGQRNEKEEVKRRKLTKRPEVETRSTSVESGITDIEEEEGADDFEKPYQTPEEYKHPDDFRDQDQDDPDFEPLASPSVVDEEEFITKSQDSERGYSNRKEEVEDNDTKENNMNDMADEEEEYSVSVGQIGNNEIGYNKSISIVRNVCYYIHEDHEVRSTT